MNTLLLCCAAVVVVVVASGGPSMAQSQDHSAKHEADMKFCMDQNKVKRDEVMGMFTDPKPNDTKQPLKCFMECKMARSGTIKNGSLAVDEAMRHLGHKDHYKGHESELRQALTECQNAKGADKCDQAFQIFLCIKNHQALDDVEDI